MLGKSRGAENPFSSSLHEPTPCLENKDVSNSTSSKRKRRPAGTPESDQHICEICNQGFQRDQNLQMHRRRHKVPWKLLKRENPGQRKRVYVCPEPSCLHHNPSHALGDLVGIKKHFKRKHSNLKEWVCGKCSKAYAVQSDYKAHLKTCGTRGHSCDCGRIFSKVESFIEHQDTCQVSCLMSDKHIPSTKQTILLSGTASSSGSASVHIPDHGAAPWLQAGSITEIGMIMKGNKDKIAADVIGNGEYHNLELQLSTTSTWYGQ
uniref:C2H2-type domain-containing protein n=1 Tax=Kalanchoe fedtschenkoi TaxID=63787 RepID=A0A7N0U3U0_KALFE